ncbi:MAG: GNAT family N-acetyltransferase [Proteobacteria bacterium]|nr:GNAT family N-acetyltransferase [Pseudomonadota bacterium]
MQIVLFDNRNRDQWDTFIDQHDHHFFHRFDWTEIFEKSYGFKPHYFGVADDDGAFHAVLPAFLTKSVVFGRAIKSMPFHIEGGAVLDRESPLKEEAVASILQYLQYLQDKYSLRSVDVKYRNGQFDNAVPEIGRRVYHTYYRYACDLTMGEDALFKSFRTDLRGSIRRSKKFNVEAWVGNNRDDIDQFYSLYLDWSKGIGLPGHSYRFFRLIWDCFFPKGMAGIAFAKIDGRLVASKLFLIDPTTGCVYQNWGAIASFDLKKFQVNSGLLWAEIKWAIDRGLNSFDFGVTSEHHTGSNYFKQAWNTEKTEVAFANFGDFEKTAIRNDHSDGKLLRKLWKRVPKSISHHVGHHILKQGN